MKIHLLYQSAIICFLQIVLPMALVGQIKAQSLEYPPNTNQSCNNSGNSGLLSWEDYFKIRPGVTNRSYNLLDPFRNGLIWYDYGVNNFRVYIFADNLCPAIVKDHDDHNLRNYDIVGRNLEITEQYLETGKALLFTYTGRRLDNIEVSKNSVCLGSRLGTTCLTATSLSREQMIQILRSERIINP